MEVQAENVGEAIEELTEKYPALHTHLFSDEGEFRPFVNLFLNDEDVRHLQGRETLLNDGDKLMILPSIAGGS
jgi:molybdopterin converting factor small subunit